MISVLFNFVFHFCFNFLAMCTFEKKKNIISGGKKDEKLILPMNDSISGTLSTDEVICNFLSRFSLPNYLNIHTKQVDQK